MRGGPLIMKEKVAYIIINREKNRPIYGIKNPKPNHLFWRKLSNLVFLLLVGIALSSCSTCPGPIGFPSEKFIIEPALKLRDIRRVGSVWGTPGGSVPSPDNPTGAHLGIDIGADENTWFVAAVPGIVGNVIEGHDYHSQITEVILRYNREFSIVYTFEPAKKIKVKKNQCVKRGDKIGMLGFREVGFIDQCVDFGVIKDGRRVCPVPYLAENFRKKLNEVYHRLEPRDPFNICNCPEHQSYFSY